MSADQQIINYGASANDGTGDPLRTAFIKTDDNFDSIWAAGPVGSNVVINGNTVRVVSLNGNLTLQANGVGSIQTSSSMLPRLGNTFDLGSADSRYRSLYVGPGGISVTGNVTGANTVTNAVYANNYFYANGTPFIGSSYGNANVAAYLPTYTGNLVSLTGNVTTTGNITANYFVGNGSQLTGLPESYTNANVAAYLPTYTGNLVSLTGNVTTTGNITANYFVGNGSQLTGLPDSYTNANVASYLAGSAGNIIPVGNNAQSLGNATNRWANLWLSGNTIQLGDLSLSAGASGLTSTAGFDLANSTAANIEATGNITADYFIGDGSQLTNLPFDASQIENGTSNVAISTANGNVTITADSAQTWTFGTSGNLQFPDGGAVIFEGGDGIIGKDGDDLLISWDDEELVLRSVSGDVQLEADNDIEIRSGYNFRTGDYGSRWIFNNNGELQGIPQDTANSSDYTGGYIQFVGNSSGDGAGYTTLQLIPDETRVGTDQYLIVDPTAPGHIHIRAGGTQDNSFADLFLGGENSYVKVGSGSNPPITVTANTESWTFDTAGNLTFPDNTVQTTAWTGILPNPTYSGSDEIGFATPAPLNLNNSAASTLLTQLNLINTGGGPGAGSAIDFWTYTSINDVPEVRLQAVDDGDYSADFAIKIKANGNGGNGNLTTTWTFGADGTLTAPGNITTTQSVEGLAVTARNINADYGNISLNPDFGLIFTQSNAVITANTQSWTFDESGNLTLPVDGYLRVTSGIVGTGASPAPSLSGFSTLSAVTANISGNITGGNVTTTGNITGNFFIGDGSQLTGITANTANITSNVITFNTAAGINVTAGQMAWNSADGTMDIGLGYGNVVLQTGQETHYVVRNETGTAISNGTAVYCSGVTPSGRISVDLMTSNISPVQFLGLATQTISNGVNGIVTWFGYVRDLDTRGTANTAISVGDETWAVGDKLYVHPTAAGKLTKVEPAAPNAKICVASIITRNQSSGVLFVRPTTNLTAADLSDVQITTPATNQFLVYVGNRWENTALDISLDTTPTLGGNLAGAGFNVSNVGNISATGNVTAQNFTGNISITGNVQGTGANVTLVAGSYDWTFDNTGNLTLPGNTFAVNYANNSPVDVVTRFEGTWTVPTGNSTQSFTVDANNTYQMWVEGNIPNGIIAWNATATITNTNVPVAGAQYAWVYSGGGTPIDFTSIPNQFEGTSNTIVRSNVAPSTTTNRFDFGINNASGNSQTVRYGWIKIS